ncbi:MAG TPA: flagellar motor switch protein FliN [Solirubrobacterales bacterium]|nr:flagellar motor switch protein FliN [Solirubrobacterales bacterium]
MTGASEVRYEELDAAVEGSGEGADLGRLQNVPVELAVEIGRTRMTIGEALALGPGSVVTVGRLAGDPVDLLVNGRVIARGEVVAIDEELGLRITEIAAGVVPDGGATEAGEPAAAASVDADPPRNAGTNGAGSGVAP